ncbi:MAG: hypothetical protein ABFS41_12650 [Myxococcota bacterium]
MLPPLYGAAVAEQVVTDYRTAEIPPRHRALFAFVERMTQRSWEMTDHDIEALRGESLSDAEIVLWVNITALQGWWTMSADASGVPLEGGALAGPLGRTREQYEAAPEGLTGGGGGAAAARASDASGCRVATDEGTPSRHQSAARAHARWGVVPNLLRASSLCPVFLPRHLLALELLERPQSGELPARTHALVRTLAAHVNRSRAFEPTLRELIRRHTGEPDLYERLATEEAAVGADEAERGLLAFAAKVVRNAYKVTEKDALHLRELGWSDAAYVDALNTAAIQTSLDRMANALGVAADAVPLLAR